MVESTHFERLGLPGRFSLDAAALERNYLARSREVHPDHAGDSAAVLEASAALNEAYSVLRDPFRRADYLIAVRGGPSAADLKQSPPEFLEEMLDLRMEIEGATADARAELERSLIARRNAFVDEAGKCLDRHDELQADDPRRRALMTEARQALNACKYVQGLLRDLPQDG